MITLREGVRNESGPGGVRLVDEHDTVIEIPKNDEHAEIYWRGSTNQNKFEAAQTMHPLDLLHALTLAGWTLEGRVEVER